MQPYFQKFHLMTPSSIESSDDFRFQSVLDDSAPLGVTDMRKSIYDLVASIV